MLKSKTFVKKTRKGGVVKVVREHYLRDDIWCGSCLCTTCPQEKPVLESDPQIESDLCNFPHYLVPDTNVLFHQIDVLEDSIIRNVIILQTVLQEIRHRSSSGHQRMRDLVSQENKKFYVFTNEHHRETYIEREAGESANDRNDRAIRVCVKWYGEHLSKQKKNEIKVVLLTNDLANRNKAREEGLLAYTVYEYVKSLIAKPELSDRLAQLAEEEHRRDTANEDIKVKGSHKISFPEHLPLTQIQTGIKSKKYLQGTFHASRENYKEGYVSAHGKDDMIFIKGLANINRAVHDDLVAIEMLPRERWTCPSSMILADETKNVDEEDEGIEEDEESNKPARKGVKSLPTAKVVGIIKRNWRPYCGILQAPVVSKGTRHLFIPAEKRIPKIRIETRQAETLLGQRIIVSIDSWPRTSRYPQGHFVRGLGPIGDKDTENEVLLLEHDVPHQNFSASVLSFLPKMPWGITEEDVSVREDLRHICICSVDPPGCTDIDDALHCRELDNGNLEVGVHIADVTHFIKPGNALDAEAANRGTTVYLVDKRIDMVPELLSSNLCSLRGNEERFAFSCIWEMTPDAEILSTKFMKSIIKSRAALTYEQAQLRIDDSSMNDDITLGLRGLNRLAKIMKRRRIEKGALTLASSEIRFSMDSETHDPIDVETKQLRETNSMVEEFMLLANISVATKIQQDFPQCALLRRHPAPPPSNYEPLIKAGESKDVKILTESNKDLATSLDKAELPGQPYFNTLLRMLATRCMMQAVYFCSGTLPEDEFYHYGLATPIYTHFTSPIRRYSDIVVHRLLAVAIGADQSYADLLEKQKVQSLCNNLNYRHKMAQYAGRASVGLHTQLFFKDKSVDEEGFILFVRKNALQILIPKFGLEGTLFLKAEKGNSLFKFNEEESSQSAGEVKFRVFDRVIVQISIDKSNIQHQKLQLKLVQPLVAGFSVSPTDQSSSSPGGEEPAAKKAKQN
ncbi:exosome complex exonuclease RRP44-like [Ptychodera flava]|uniref:exosome complex exonuclease RRP44-like n=1 Tax=Ptychodera flava TaxID=63121 RepID=UPI003969D776